jgi:hypothetical protein
MVMSHNAKVTVRKLFGIIVFFIFLVVPGPTPIPNGTRVSSPEMEKKVLFRPEYWLIIIIGFLIISSNLIINSRRKQMYGT